MRAAEDAGWTSCAVMLLQRSPACASSSLHHPLPPALPPRRPSDIARRCLALADGAGEVRRIPPAWQGKAGGGREIFVSDEKCCIFFILAANQLPNHSTPALSELPYKIPGGEERFLLGVYAGVTLRQPGTGRGDGGRAKFGSYKVTTGPVHSSSRQHRRELHVQPPHKRSCG